MERGFSRQAARRGDELVINCLRSLAMDAVQQVGGLQRSAVGGGKGGIRASLVITWEPCLFWGGQQSNLMLKFVW